MQCKYIYVGTHNLGLSQLKQVLFGHAKYLPHNGIFGHANFGKWGHLFCTKYLDTKMEIDWESKAKKHLDLAHES